MGRTLEMKMAKASDDDIHDVMTFLIDLESVVEEGYYPNADEEDHGEFPARDRSDESLAAFVRQRWPAVSVAWRRVVFGCDMLIKNCCDPAADVLEWRPDIAELLAAKSAGSSEQDVAAPSAEVCDGG